MAYKPAFIPSVETENGLDCIDISIYINGEHDFDDVNLIQDLMDEIQSDFIYNHLPSDAMYFFKKAEFHNDVFRFFNEDDFAWYLKERFGY